MKQILKNKFNMDTRLPGNCEAWLNKVIAELIVGHMAHISAPGILNLGSYFPLIDRFWTFPNKTHAVSSAEIGNVTPKFL